MPTTSPRSDTPRIAQLDAARAAAWEVLRRLSGRDGNGIPGHEEGRRIVTAALRCDQITAAEALDVVDPTGKAFPVAIVAAWEARKANG